MIVLVADKFEQMGLDGLAALGVTVEYKPDLKDASLAAALKELQADVLVVRGTKVTEDMMEGSKLGLIIRAGAGYNTIDVAAASRLGIYVTNCPGKNGQAVAELAFGLIIACDRNIHECVSDIRIGKWNKKTLSISKGLYGRTLGLVGMGKIGQEMIQRARAFGMNVVAYSRWMTPEIAAALGIGRAATLSELAQQSDFISVHVSLTPETRGMLDAKFFQAMKPGAVFINTSRAEVVNQADLEQVLNDHKIKAGLDVFEGEPDTGEADIDLPLSKLKNVIITHHIGAGTDQAQEAVAMETVRIVKEYKSTGVVPNVVNVKKAELATHVLMVRHIDKVGVLANVLNVLKDEGISVQEMENIILGGAKAAIAQISIDKPVSDSGLFRLKQDPNVFDANQIPLNREGDSD